MSNAFDRINVYLSNQIDSNGSTIRISGEHFTHRKK